MAKTKTPTIVPLGDRVLIQRVEAEEMTRGGIVLPDTAKEKPKEGEIVSTGKGRLIDGGERAEVEHGGCGQIRRIHAEELGDQSEMATRGDGEELREALNQPPQNRFDHHERLHRQGW